MENKEKIFVVVACVILAFSLVFFYAGVKLSAYEEGYNAGVSKSSQPATERYLSEEEIIEIIDSHIEARILELDFEKMVGTLGEAIANRILADPKSSIIAPYLPATDSVWPKTAYTKTDGLRLRESPDTTSRIINSFSANTPVTIVGESGNWYHVTAGGKQGYMSKDYVSIGSAPAAKAKPQISQPQSSSVSNERTVYVTNTGHKYHSAGCRYLSRSCNPIRLSRAKGAGYTPCSVCGG